MGLSWRLTLCLPGTLFLLVALGCKTCCLDMPTGKFDITVLGKSSANAKLAYWQALTDIRVVLMIFQYSASFGTELVMNNFLATHFNDYFEVSLVAAGALALGFGGMNFFARSVGGIVSDWADNKYDMRGRLWTHFVATFGSSAFMFLFGCMNKDMGWLPALLVLCVFATFINMAEGTAYAIVPFMQPMNLGVVSGLVGAGGTAGGVIQTTLFYKSYDSLTSLQLHSGYIMVAAVSCFFMWWPQFGSMLTAPRAKLEGEKLESIGPADTKQDSVFDANIIGVADPKQERIGAADPKQDATITSVDPSAAFMQKKDATIRDPHEVSRSLVPQQPCPWASIWYRFALCAMCSRESISDAV